MVLVISDVISHRLRVSENESELSTDDEKECFNAEDVVVGERLMEIQKASYTYQFSFFVIVTRCWQLVM